MGEPVPSRSPEKQFLGMRNRFGTRSQVRGRRHIRERVRQAAVDQNARRAVAGYADIWRRNADILLFRMDNQQDRAQALHVAGAVRLHHPAVFLFGYKKPRLDVADRDPERHDVRAGPCRVRVVLENDLATWHQLHRYRARRPVRLHR